MSIRTERIHLIRRPVATPSPDDFELAEVILPDLSEGDVLVENLWMSVDPYMRRSMDADGKDLEPWPIRGPLDGPSVGRVVESRHPDHRPGDIVESMSGWQRHFISDGTPFVPYLTSNTAIVRRSHVGAEPRDYVGLLGIASLTAYAAMVCRGEYKPGDTVVVSSGAGTVGSVACQIAKNRGARVVTSAGSDDKVRWLREEVGVDHAFNYRAAPIATALRDACPDGIDFVLENASPEHLSACLPLMNELATILVSGFVSLYSAGGRAAPLEHFEYVLDRFLTIRAFRFMDSLHAYDDFVRHMLDWRAGGRLIFRETIYDGLARAPEALCGLFGHNVSGKCLIRIGSAE